jgi:Fic family protein
MARTSNLPNQIELLKQQYLKLSAGKQSLITLLNETEVPEFVYNSNAIENSTLTLEETEKILLQVDLERYASEREIYEAKNLARVMEYVHQKATQINLTKEMILTLHQMLIGNIRPEIAGRYRTKNEWVKVGGHIAVSPAVVETEMEKLLIEYSINDKLTIQEKLAIFHLRFEEIHPFVDGNGRIGRVLINYLLLRENYVPINISFRDRSLYYTCFKEFESNNYTGTMQTMINLSLSESFNKRIAYLRDLDIVTLSEYSTLTTQSLNTIINKANRQTIPAFRLKNKWRIGIERK